VPNMPADEQRINAIRFLSVDAVDKAKSGHPGLPLGAAGQAFQTRAKRPVNGSDTDAPFATEVQSFLPLRCGDARTWFPQKRVSRKRRQSGLLRYP